MFEDIKKMIADLAGHTSRRPAIDITEFNTRLQKIEDAIAGLKQAGGITPERLDSLRKDIVVIVKYTLDTLNGSIAESRKVIEERLDRITARLEGILSAPPVKTIIRREFGLPSDLSSRRASAVMGLMGLAIIFSVAGNMHQCSRSRQYRDNDIKYRYIRMANGITPDNLYRLEGFFNYPDSAFMVKQIRHWVYNYEDNVRKQIAVPGQCFPVFRESENAQPTAQSNRKR